MQALQAALPNQSTRPTFQSVQQQGLRARNDEIERLRTELATSRRKISDYEAGALRQLTAFQNEMSSKTDRITYLERQLMTSNNLSQPHIHMETTLRTTSLGTENERLQHEVSSHQERIAQLVVEKEAMMEMNRSLQQSLDTTTDEKVALLAQLDSSDILGEDYGNSNLGAPSCEQDAHGQGSSEVEGQMIIHDQTLQDEIAAHIATIAELEVRLEANNITMQLLHDIQAERHVSVTYNMADEADYLRELDVDRILQISTAAQWHTDIATIVRNAPTPTGFINVTMLAVESGVRSVTVKIPADNISTTRALLTCLRRRDRNYGLYLTLPDESKGTITSKVLVHQPDEAEAFIRACQQKNARVFSGPYDGFARFFEEYKIVYLREQGRSSNKRAGGLLQSEKRRHVGELARPTLTEPESKRERATLADFEEGEEL